MKSISLGKLLLILSLLYLLTSVALIYAISGFIKGRAVKDLAENDARDTSALVFQTLFTAMQAGASKNSLDELIMEIEASVPSVKINVHRGKVVVEQHGYRRPLKMSRANDPMVNNALNNAEESSVIMGDQLRFVYPVLFQTRCLVCHLNAKPGVVAGAIDINHYVEDLKISVDLIIKIMLGYLVSVLLFLFIAMYFKLNRFIARPISRLDNVIREISVSADLEQRVPNLSWLTEVQSLTSHFNRMLVTLDNYQQKVEEFAVQDTLTGLLNRHRFNENLEYEVDRASRHKSNFCVIQLDIVNFRFVNDSYGYPAGDMVLQQLAKFLESNTRTGDSLARVSSNEFAIILPETDRNAGITFSEKIIRGINGKSFKFQEFEFRIHGMVSLTTFPNNGKSVEELTIAMDMAMRKAKKGESGDVVTINQEEQQEAFAELSKGDFIRTALDEDRIEAFLQPVVEVEGKKIFAYEVLARIREGDKYIPAHFFIDMVEPLGLAKELDIRVLERGIICKREAGIKDAKMFFNLSPRSFKSIETMNLLVQKLKDANINLSDVVFEITEREALPNMSEIARMIENFRKEGLRFALDDFGSGFSSFLYLKYMNVDYVKIEGNFIRQIVHDERDRIMVKHITNAVHEFGIMALAEMVEDEETHELLKSFNIELGQGYHYGYPAICKDVVKKIS